MIINYDSPGQMCNRIWSLVPSIAYGLEYKEKVLIINFSEYSGSFENLNSNKLIRFAKLKLLKKLIFSMKVRGYIENGGSNIFSKLFGLNMIEGWSNRLGNAKMVEKQSDEIRNIFSFKRGLKEEIDRQFEGLKDYLVIGIHIRRGDYATWLAGIYYCPDDEYERIMKSINEKMKLTDHKVKFLLCSNEKINLSRFSDLDCFIIPNSSGEKDLYALTKCSYIIGPPSSYSQWASFMGRVPIKYILSAGEKIDLSDLSQVVSFNTFANGKILNID